MALEAPPVISPTAPAIGSAGISAPAYADILAYLQAQYRSIFGSDVYLGSDSQDGQFLAIIADAINDANAAAIAVYNAFSPATAQGADLSSVVKINGLARNAASYSTVDVVITGVAGTSIFLGVVQDTAGFKWNLPLFAVIPSGGQITVTATCQTIGAITALPGTVSQIATPTLGWQSATNPAAAAVGAPVETDAALRQRQSRSTAIPSLTVLDGMIGAVAAVPGVTRYAAYENDTASTDANGIPPHSVSFVAEGGDAAAIASAIAAKKTPGAGTYGTTSETITDVYGIPHTINFFRPTDVPVTAAITLKALTGYTSAIGAEIQNAISAYIGSLAIGQKVMLTRLYLPANLSGAADSATYEITSLTLNGSAADVAIAFNQVATCTPANVVLTVT